jgi:hypothetical protein
MAVSGLGDKSDAAAAASASRSREKHRPQAALTIAAIDSLKNSRLEFQPSRPFATIRLGYFK